MYDWIDLVGQNRAWTQGVCRELGIKGFSKMTVVQMRRAILTHCGQEIPQKWKEL
jgi:hypothetical protein